MTTNPSRKQIKTASKEIKASVAVASFVLKSGLLLDQNIL